MRPSLGVVHKTPLPFGPEKGYLTVSMHQVNNGFKGAGSRWQDRSSWYYKGGRGGGMMMAILLLFLTEIESNNNKTKETRCLQSTAPKSKVQCQGLELPYKETCRMFASPQIKWDVKLCYGPLCPVALTLCIIAVE